MECDDDAAGGSGRNSRSREAEGTTAGSTWSSPPSRSARPSGRKTCTLAGSRHHRAAEARSEAPPDSPCPHATPRSSSSNRATETPTECLRRRGWLLLPDVCDEGNGSADVFRGPAVDADAEARRLLAVLTSLHPFRQSVGKLVPTSVPLDTASDSLLTLAPPPLTGRRLSPRAPSPGNPWNTCSLYNWCGPADPPASSLPYGPTNDHSSARRSPLVLLRPWITRLAADGSSLCILRQSHLPAVSRALLLHQASLPRRILESWARSAAQTSLPCPEGSLPARHARVTFLRACVCPEGHGPGGRHGGAGRRSRIPRVPPRALDDDVCASGQQRRHAVARLRDATLDDAVRTYDGRHPVGRRGRYDPSRPTGRGGR